ncbi:hypothetical protein RMCBS344292_12944 [Rhizopus microsporus]|nr:hypothetical protein RMCBS344292_12944 [Rhizopus microsporus]
MIPAIGEALLYVRYLQRDLARSLRLSHNNWESPCKISVLSIQELKWWLNRESIKNVLPIRRPLLVPDLTIYVDASDSGWGVSSASVQTAEFWTRFEKEESINVRELKSILFALQLHMPRYKNCNLKIYSDNRTALKYINKAEGTASEALQELAIRIQQLCNRYKKISTTVRVGITKEMVPTTPTHVGPPIVQNRRLCSEAQQEITSLLEFTARSRSSSGGCIQPDMAKEGFVFESTLETNFQSTKEDSRGQSQTSYFNSPIVANSMLVETDTTNEALESTDIDKAQPSMATSRMDVIFRERITEGLTIQEVECLSQATRSKTQKGYDHGWRVWSNWYEKYDLGPQAYDPQIVFRFLNARAHLSAPTLNVY